MPAPNENALFAQLLGCSLRVHSRHKLSRIRRSGKIRPANGQLRSSGGHEEDVAGTFHRLDRFHTGGEI